MLKVHKIHRGPVKKTAWDYESASSAKENILQLLYDFLNQFLSGGYNGKLMGLRFYSFIVSASFYVLALLAYCNTLLISSYAVCV